MPDSEFLSAFQVILELALSRVEERLAAKIDSVRDELNAKIDSVRDELNAKIDSVRDELNAKIDATEGRLNARIDATESRLNARIDATESRLNARIDAVEGRVELVRKELHARMDALQNRNAAAHLELEGKITLTFKAAEEASRNGREAGQEVKVVQASLHKLERDLKEYSRRAMASHRDATSALALHEELDERCSEIERHLEVTESTVVEIKNQLHIGDQP